jgi:hypothetical protein
MYTDRTVTARIIDYETIAIVFHWDAGRWRIVTVNQLGIS